MAKHRPKVPAPMKRILLQQTGYKCANPGCSNRLLEIHHIKEWAVYQTHDEESMIAICPSCHDAVTRGELTISDDELYYWKGIERLPVVLTGYIFVEPHVFPRLVLGDFNFIGPEGVTIVEFEHTKLSLAVREGELAILNLKTVDAVGNSVLDVVDNYVRQRDPDVVIDSRPGRYRVTTNDYNRFYPQWVRESLSKGAPHHDPAHFGVLDIVVLAPGEVRVRGIFLGDSGALVIDDHDILLISRKAKVALGLAVEGQGRATLVTMGAIDKSIFGQYITVGFW
jgi:hypothetical protein